jgi:hypothetical protein
MAATGKRARNFDIINNMEKRLDLGVTRRGGLDCSEGKVKSGLFAARLGYSYVTSLIAVQERQP